LLQQQIGWTNKTFRWLSSYGSLGFMVAAGRKSATLVFFYQPLPYRANTGVFEAISFPK
jgi:hypothetical protein